MFSQINPQYHSQLVVRLIAQSYSYNVRKFVDLRHIFKHNVARLHLLFNELVVYSNLLRSLI